LILSLALFKTPFFLLNNTRKSGKCKIFFDFQAKIGAQRLTFEGKWPFFEPEDDGHKRNANLPGLFLFPRVELQPQPGFSH